MVVVVVVGVVVVVIVVVKVAQGEPHPLHGLRGLSRDDVTGGCLQVPLSPPTEMTGGGAIDRSSRGVRGPRGRIGERRHVVLHGVEQLPVLPVHSVELRQQLIYIYIFNE